MPPAISSRSRRAGERPAFLHRHGLSLQALDLINQNLRHLAGVSPPPTRMLRPSGSASRAAAAADPQEIRASGGRADVDRSPFSVSDGEASWGGCAALPGAATSPSSGRRPALAPPLHRLRRSLTVADSRPNLMSSDPERRRAFEPGLRAAGFPPREPREPDRLQHLLAYLLSQLLFSDIFRALRSGVAKFGDPGPSRRRLRS